MNLMRRLYVALMIIGTIAFPAVFLAMDFVFGAERWLFYPSLLEYLPAFIATVIGVFVGISLERNIQDDQTRQRIDEMKTVLKDELERMVAYLEPQKGNNLQDHVWDSLINSGNILLFDSKLQRNLFKIYDQVKNLNIDLRREEFAEQATKTDKFDTESMMHHSDLHRRNRLKERNLVEEIKKLIESEIFDPKIKHLESS